MDDITSPEGHSQIQDI